MLITFQIADLWKNFFLDLLVTVQLVLGFQTFIFTLSFVPPFDISVPVLPLDARLFLIHLYFSCFFLGLAIGVFYPFTSFCLFLNLLMAALRQCRIISEIQTVLGGLTFVHCIPCLFPSTVISRIKENLKTRVVFFFCNFSMSR